MGVGETTVTYEQHYALGKSQAESGILLVRDMRKSIK